MRLSLFLTGIFALGIITLSLKIKEINMKLIKILSVILALLMLFAFVGKTPIPQAVTAPQLQ